MDTRTLVGIVIALIVGVLIGRLRRHARHAVISVGKDGKVDPEEVTLNKNRREVAFWACDDPDIDLFIEFEQNNPFEQMAQPPNGNRWRVRCQQETCFSGHISDKAPGGGARYKYWQVLKERKTGKTIAEVDGIIIIRP